MLPFRDPHILLSYLNTKLRDAYPSLEALCEDWGVDAKEIDDLLHPIGYFYDAAANQYKARL